MRTLTYIAVGLVYLLRVLVTVPICLLILVIAGAAWFIIIPAYGAAWVIEKSANGVADGCNRVNNWRGRLDARMDAWQMRTMQGLKRK